MTRSAGINADQSGAAPSQLELRLLGPVRIAVDGVPVEERLWTRRKAKSLVKILALEPHHQLHREQLMECLWPELEPELAANNLHKIIHAARRALEPGLRSGAESNFILTHDQQVILRAPGDLWIDAELFERRAAEALRGRDRAAYEAALELYAGDLLGEDRYEDWAAARREQLRLLAERLLAALAQLYEADAQPQRSIERFKQLLLFNPANEEAHRHLMRLYALTGSRHQALHQYQLCREALWKDLDAEPEPVTVELYDRIAAGGLQPPAGETGGHEPRPDPAPPAAAPPRRRAKLAALGVAAVALLLIAGLGLRLYRGAGGGPAVESLAVLPFVNESADPNLDYLSDGVTESIIYSLSHLPALRVMARATVFRYKGRELDPLAIGRELNVRAVLTGRVRERQGNLIIQAELIDVGDGAQLWGAQYDRRLADIFAVQTGIAREIAEKLRLHLTSEERSRLAKRPTENVEAYQAYLKGRYYWSRRTAPETRRAIEHLRQAIAFDPAYALAYAGLADAYYSLSNLQQLPPREAIPLAQAAALKALELDDRLGAAHAALALVKWRYEWDWRGAEGEFQRAIALDPNYPPARQWYGLLLCYQQQFDAARVELREAQQLDPLSLVINANLGLPLYFARQYEPAIAQFRRALELDQNFPFAHYFLGWAYEQQGDFSRAIESFRQARQLSDTAAARAYLGHAYAASGDRAAAERILAELQERAKESYVSPYYLALICAGLGERERALDHLRQAAEDRSDLMVLLKVEPKLDPLRATPQFADLLRRVGLEP